MQEHVKMWEPCRVLLCNEEVSETGLRLLSDPFQELGYLLADISHPECELFGRWQGVVIDRTHPALAETAPF